MIVLVNKNRITVQHPKGVLRVTLRYYSSILDVCPPIVDGPLYGAFHGVIQMAYGMACGSDEMVVEGIGYMYHQYSPMYIDDINNPKVCGREML